MPIYRDAYRLVLKVFETTRDFSKEYKYSLGQDIKRDSLELIRNIYRANKYREKAIYLDNFLDNLEILRLQIRLACDLKIISIKKQAEIIELMDGVGRQANGWKKSNVMLCDSERF